MKWTAVALPALRQSIDRGPYLDILALPPLRTSIDLAIIPAPSPAILTSSIASPFETNRNGEG